MSPADAVISPSACARPPEAVALFNAAFTAEILVNACWSKADQGQPGLSWPNAFLILPLCLHPATRTTLSSDKRITLARWAVRNPDLLADMQYRVVAMAAQTKRAIRHGLRTERLGLAGTDLVARAKPKNPTSAWPAELRESVRAARICGRWFNATETHLAFELLGIEG